MCLGLSSARQADGSVKMFPCGLCPKCKKSHLNGWLFRLIEENRHSFNPLFVLLTYDEMSVLWNVQAKSRTLYKPHLQNWMKSLRRYNAKKGDAKIVYYAVGEYGKNGTQRPHYHVLLFNVYDAQDVQKAWPHGFASYPALRDADSGKGIRYVLKYISKDRRRYSYVQPEFSLMSKNIGLSYLTPAMQNYHISSVENRFHSLGRGIKIPMIRYYKKRLLTGDEYQETSQYMQRLADEKREENILYLMQSRKIDRKKAEENLDLSNIMIKFTPRIKDVL